MSLTLRIEKLVHGGRGLAFHDHKALFVPGAMDGETVEAEIAGWAGGCAVARVVRILSPSPHRRRPFCPWVGRCGGCDWQHIAPERQAPAKLAIFLDCVKRQGKFELQSSLVEVVAAQETGYRHRVQFQVDGCSRRAGFFRAGSSTVVPIDSCPLLVAPLNRFLSELGRHVEDLPAQCRQVKAIAGADGSVASDPPLPALSSQETTLSFDGLLFRVTGACFFQQNALLAGALGGWARGKVVGERLIDLYGGVGFFSVFLAREFRAGVLVEQNAAMVRLAEDNFRANGLEHFRGRQSGAEGFLSDAARRPAHTDCVVVDPPRQGLSSAVRRGIAALRPRRLLYVACDPATQARDAGFFVNECGYRVTHAALFDLYPNTHHLETALVLAGHE